MENNSERPSSRIIFTNSPRLNEWASDEERELRQRAPAAIRNLISTSPLFGHESVSVHFFRAGVSSIVSNISTRDKKYVLKFPLAATQDTGEARFLRAWKRFGIPVPHVIDEGTILDRPYVLMDYIDARPLNATMTGEEVLNGHHFERMGQTLARLHAVTSRGYGRPRGEQGEYQHFHDWLRNNAERHIAYVRQNNLLNENDYGSVGFACGTLVEFVQRNDSSVYCHNDFSVANVLDTIPLTVFDPDPIINHPYLDLARSIILIANAKIQIVDAADQLLHGYVSVAGPIDVAILRASLILQVYLKIPFWNETRQYAKVALVQAYLRQ